jgi:sulfide dehydrogenase cytochrome subunit
MKPKYLALSAMVGALLGATTLSAAEIRSATALAGTCAGCHGTNGYSVGDTMPSIAGLNKRYLVKTMEDFKSDVRPSTIMGRIARGYSDQDLETIAAFFAAQEWQAAPQKVDAKKAEAGARLHEEACATCHGRDGSYNEKETPRLAGQWLRYTYMQLVDLHDIERPTADPHEMHKRIEKLSKEEIDALSNYYASVK